MTKPFLSIARFCAQVARRIRGHTGLPTRFRRHQYKRVWNSVSGTDRDAIRAVAGHTDEDVLRVSAGEFIPVLKECVGLNHNDVVLEIGAGVGRVGMALAPLCREWIGADVSENMVRHMSRRLAGLPNVRAVAINGFDLAPIASDSVDLVYSTVVFMHLDEWDGYGYVKEALRVLRPGGRLYVDNINLLSDEGWSFFLAHHAIPPNERPNNISKTSTPPELAAYLSRAGFIDVRLREDGPWIRAFGTKQDWSPACEG